MNNISEIGDIRERLLDRKNHLMNLAQKFISTAEILRLIEEIDSALKRMTNGTYGLCEVCGDPIEPDRLKADPLLKVCLDDFSAEQQKNLENELSLAVKVQQNLLPTENISLPGWDIDYHYEPASIVSGDYCDLIIPDERSENQYVIVGDVTGKGVAASMLMTHLHAMFHTLVPFNLKLSELMERINRVLCESTADDLFATLVLARAHKDGTIEISNAGHCLPILITESGAIEPGSNGVPLGILCQATYESTSFKMHRGDVLILYTDGLTEAMNGDDCFELSRILQYQHEFRDMSPREIIETINAELSAFLDGSVKSDDLTLMVLKKL
ncbi:MAG: SpoIIE family protein phosphatase [Bacteroidota bacterium]|nr:SpoIIE family protein phosphatase [Bacteroidota bacterium]MDP4191886.1 SpoIIE family protein phosphatase [Bacteroidota bacterium]MDP4194874.1 SpoIIE family protein phosphatase [Bacteroidota bacterium]